MLSCTSWLKTTIDIYGLRKNLEPPYHLPKEVVEHIVDLIEQYGNKVGGYYPAGTLDCLPVAGTPSKHIDNCLDVPGNVQRPLREHVKLTSVVSWHLVNLFVIV